MKKKKHDRNYLKYKNNLQKIEMFLQYIPRTFGLLNPRPLRSEVNQNHHEAQTIHAVV